MNSGVPNTGVCGSTTLVLKTSTSILKGCVSKANTLVKKTTLAMRGCDEQGWVVTDNDKSHVDSFETLSGEPQWFSIEFGTFLSSFTSY